MSLPGLLLPRRAPPSFDQLPHVAVVTHPVANIALPLVPQEPFEGDVRKGMNHTVVAYPASDKVRVNTGSADGCVYQAYGNIQLGMELASEVIQNSRKAGSLTSARR